MFDELKREIEIFTKRQINLFHRSNIRTVEFDESSKLWQEILGSTHAVSDIIWKIWNPISADARKLVELLAARTLDIILISETNNRPIALGYVFQIRSTKFQRTYTSAWVGGLPLRQERIDINIPDVYLEFCKIHNGFVLDGNFAIGFLPIQKLRTIMTEDGKKLLEFCGDALGNSRCFDLTNPSCETIDWDHETLQTSNPMSFWDFAYYFVSKNMPSQNENNSKQATTAL
jgi:hypothetical protein